MSVPSTEPSSYPSGRIAIPSIDYIEELDPDLHARVRARFARDIDALTGLRFRELSFYSEQFGLFSSLIGLPMSVAMLIKREVMRLDSGLRVRASFILMSHSKPATVALPSKWTIADAWTQHQQRVRELEAAGKTIRSSVHFHDYVEASHQEAAAIS